MRILIITAVTLIISISSIKAANFSPPDVNTQIDNVGIHLSSADLNGDGYSDIITTSAGNANGRVYIYYGSSSGVNVVSELFLSGMLQATSAGDINNDGYDDILTAGPSLTITNDMSKTSIFVYYGSASGVVNNPVTVEDNVFGQAISSAGDVNSDGFDDVIVGGYYSEHDIPDRGRGSAILYYGSNIGINSNNKTSLTTDDYKNGKVVLSKGDVNGDGYSDILVGSGSGSGDSALFIYHGSASFVNLPDSIITASMYSGVFENMFTFSLSSADINGDGNDDIIAKNHIIHGNSSGISSGSAIDIVNTTVEYDVSLFGRASSGIGDINGDGYDDVIIGAPRYANEGGTNEGAVLIFAGTSQGLSTKVGEIIEGGTHRMQFGSTVSGAGDINGDGKLDFLASSRYNDQGNGHPTTYVYHGYKELIINNAPTISGAPPSTASVNTPYTFFPQTSDIEQDVLQFSIENNPGWLIINRNSGELSGTPTSGDIGTVQDVVVSVTDGNFSTSLPKFNCYHISI